MAALIDELNLLQPQLPAPARERARLLVAHARTASSAQEDVDPLVRRDVLDSGVDAQLAQLERAYAQVFEGQLGQASRYRSVLYAWSCLLLLAVLAAAFQLRSVLAAQSSDPELRRCVSVCAAHRVRPGCAFASSSKFR